MGEWQPIETAPKDGAWVFIYWPSMSITLFPLVVFWDGEDWNTVASIGHVGAETPTHWMPLPEAPHDL
jgi:hypothetical protein